MSEALVPPAGASASDVDSPWTQNRSTALMMIIPTEPARALRAVDRIVRLLREEAYGDKDVFAVTFALEEAITNAMKHGNRMDPAKNVQVHYRITAERCDLCICDEGPGFDPAKVPDPLSEVDRDDLYGRGLLLMRYYMDQVIFHYPGNRVTLSKINKRKT